MARAVFMLTEIVKEVGCSMGKVAGSAPRRISLT
jgi:hypothetical protein